jgi:hypothetical protein
MTNQRAFAQVQTTKLAVAAKLDQVERDYKEAVEKEQWKR